MISQKKSDRQNWRFVAFTNGKLLVISFDLQRDIKWQINVKKYLPSRFNKIFYNLKTFSEFLYYLLQPHKFNNSKHYFDFYRTNPHLQPSALKNFTRNQKLTLASLALVDFMSFCSMSIMAPFFPREAAEKGMSDTLSGFVFSFYALVMFITSPIIGKIVSFHH